MRVVRHLYVATILPIIKENGSGRSKFRNHGGVLYSGRGTGSAHLNFNKVYILLTLYSKITDNMYTV